MGKFFYRLTLQAVIKAALTVVITFFCTYLFYFLFTTLLAPFGAKFDYWLQAVAALIVCAITCFMLIEVKDDYATRDTYSSSAGRFWSERAYKRKKVSFFTVELMMLPLLAVAVVFGYLFYRDHAAVMEEYVAFYAAKDALTVSGAQNFYVEHIEHFAKLVLAVFFFAQWRHVREFSVKGRCPYCRAAFSLDFHRIGGTETKASSKITKKSKTRVVGANYQVETEDGEEIDRTKISDVYGKTYDYYKTDTTTTYRTSVCHCAICGNLSNQTDVYSTYKKTKLP